MRLLAAVLTLALAAPAAAAPTLTLERVAVLMRHGVRPPTRALPLPEAAVDGRWPAWPVGWGELTPHGAQAVRALAAFDREEDARRGLVPGSGCPEPGAVEIYADSDQRTIATGEAVAAAYAPGCDVRVAHRPQGEDDPLFSPVQTGAVAYDPARARAAVLAHGALLAVREAQARPLLARLQAILKPGCSSGCVLSGSSRLAPPRDRARPKLEGPLDLGSTAAQVLVLQYAEGKPLSEVGFGRATADDVSRIAALHPLEFDIVARPSYVAARNVSGVAPWMLRVLEAPGGPRLGVLVGHDTNIASLGGLLDLHWRVDGFPADDPPPGGGLRFELWRDGQGGRFVRAVYESASLEQIRAAAPLTAARPPIRQVLAIPGCGAPCPAGRFSALVRRKLRAAGVAAS